MVVLIFLSGKALDKGLEDDSVRVAPFHPAGAERRRPESSPQDKRAGVCQRVSSKPHAAFE